METHAWEIAGEVAIAEVDVEHIAACYVAAKAVKAEEGPATCAMEGSRGSRFAHQVASLRVPCWKRTFPGAGRCLVDVAASDQVGAACAVGPWVKAPCCFVEETVHGRVGRPEVDLTFAVSVLAGCTGCQAW